MAPATDVVTLPKPRLETVDAIPAYPVKEPAPLAAAVERP
jgi:hypothetical protein